MNLSESLSIMLQKKQFPSETLFVLIVFLACFSCPPLIHAEDSSRSIKESNTLRGTAVVSDLNPSDLNPSDLTPKDLTPEAVAREIITIQQQLGGPAVSPQWPHSGNPSSKALITDHPDFADPRTVSSTQSSYANFQSSRANPQAKKVETLREVAFRLDATAHELEKLDLYEQADSLRQVASRLRKDARALKQELPSGTFSPPTQLPVNRTDRGSRR